MTKASRPTLSAESDYSALLLAFLFDRPHDGDYGGAMDNIRMKTPLKDNSQNLPPLKPLAVQRRVAAQMLGVCPETLYRWTRDGHIKCVRVGGACLYRISDLEAFATPI